MNIAKIHVWKVPVLLYGVLADMSIDIYTWAGWKKRRSRIIC